MDLRPEGHPCMYRLYQPCTRRWSCQNWSRSLNFCSLPVAVRGSSSMKSIDVGHLKCAMLSRTATGKLQKFKLREQFWQEERRVQG